MVLGGVQHGKIHDTGDEKNHTHKRVVHIMEVSPSGSDTIGDGTHYNPFLTANAAIERAVALSWTHVSIYFDPTGASYTVTIPDGLEVSLCAMEALYAQSASIDEIIIGNSCNLSMDNLYVVVIKEAAGITFSELLIEECVVERITDSIGGLPTKLDLTISNMFGDGATRTDLDGASGARGTTIDINTGKIYTYGGLDAKGNEITSVADPNAAQSAATRNYVDTHLTTPTIIQDSDATEFTTTNTAFTQAKRFTKTTEAAKYLVQMYCEIYQSLKDKAVYVQGQIDDTTDVLQSWDIPGQADAQDKPKCVTGTIFVTLTAASHNFDFDIKQALGGTAKAKNFRLIITKVVE